MALGTTKIINLKDLGSGTAGQRVQTFTADGALTVFTITNFTPDDKLTISVNGVGWDEGWTLIGNDITFDFPPKKNAIVTAEN